MRCYSLVFSMVRRHVNKKCAFPAIQQSVEEKEMLAKPLKAYKEELNTVMDGFKQRKRVRQQGKFKIDQVKIPKSGTLVGGMRADLMRKKKLRSN
jgi:hypothetical protein